MSKSSVPKLTKYMYVALDLIHKQGVVAEPRKTLPDLIQQELNLPGTILALTKKNGIPLHNDRTGWALTYLKKAELIHFPKRGDASITEHGLTMLEKNQASQEIKVKDLLLLSAFKQFYTVKKYIRRTKEEIATVNADADNRMMIAIDKNLFPDVLRDLLSAGYTVKNVNNMLSIVKDN